MNLEKAITVFGEGFCFTRSFTHPYIVVKEGPLWVLRDDPKRGKPRSEEVLIYGLTAKEAIHAIREYGPGRYKLCVIHGPDQDVEAVRREYKAAGFRAMSQEPFFVHDLLELPEADSRVRRVSTQDEAEEVGKAAGSRQMLTDYIGPDDSPLRLYAAYVEGKPVGWVRSIRVGEAAWVSNLYVRPEHRRAGLGRSLMATMLADDHRLGIRYSVLLASLAGAKLYPHLGYRQIGTLQLFSPAARAGEKYVA